MTIQVFVLDEEDSRERRPWKDLVEGVRFSERDAISGAIDPLPVLGSVLIYHDRDDAVVEELKLLATSGVWVLLISLAQCEGQLVAPGVYRRGRGVLKEPRPGDSHFAASFRRFRRELERTGTPEWALLEGPPSATSLAAYHWLCLAGDDVASERSALRALAIAEADAIADATNRRRLADIDDAVQRAEFLRECDLS